MKLSIIIVSWNTKELLRQCLVSIEKYKSNATYEVVVVDNASKDGTVDMVKKEFKWVRLIANHENAGFAKANNQGAEKCSGDYLLFLNPDTEVLEGTLDGLLSYADKIKEFGVIGTHILNPDHSTQPSVRRFPDLLSMIIYQLKLTKIFKNIPPLSWYLMNKFNYQASQAVDQVMGACFLVKREVWNKLQGFDEGYWIWFEEVDFCKSARKLGFPTYYCADAAIIHHGGQSFGQVKSMQKQKAWNQSLSRYMQKHMPKWQYWVMKPMFGISQIESLLLQAVRGGREF